jgi:hypothetical protein
MSIVAWRVRFEYRVENQPDWRPDSAIVVADEHGGKAANYCQECMVGTVVKFTIPNSKLSLEMSSQFVTVEYKIVEWRLTGLEQIGKVNFMDTEVLEAAGVFERIDEPTTEAKLPDLMPTE